MENIIIRTANVNDAEELLKIYAPYVVKTSVSFEYEVPSVNEFRERIASTLKRYPYLAAECNGKLVGYAYLSKFKERKAYQFCAETSIYLAEDCRGKGIGKLLYDELEKMAKKQGILNLNACIAYPNPQSEAFHEKLGYKKIAHFSKCGYKFGKWHDMIWMEKFMGEHEDCPKAFIPFENLK